MKEETQPQPEEQPAPEQHEAALVAPAEPMFTQEQMNAAAAKAAAKAKRQVRREMETQMAQPKTTEPTALPAQPDEPPAWAAEFIADVKEIKAHRESEEVDNNFSAAISGLELDGDDRESLRLSFEHNPDLFARKLAKLKSVHLPPEPKGPGFNGIGAPSPVPSSELDGNPSSWDADTVARYRADGSFLNRIEAHKRKLPGGSGGLFKAKSHKKG